MVCSRIACRQWRTTAMGIVELVVILRCRLVAKMA
jgi:hypothetical protein